MLLRGKSTQRSWVPPVAPPGQSMQDEVAFSDNDTVVANSDGAVQTQGSKEPQTLEPCLRTFAL